MGFVEMLMSDAIDLSWSSEAERKVNEEVADNIVNLQEHRRHRRHHTVPERRRWDAKAKAYCMPKCGLRPAQIRALPKSESEKLITISRKEFDQIRHSDRAYSVWSRAEAKRVRHPKTELINAIDEFELEEQDSDEPDFDEDKDVLSTDESLEVISEMKCPIGMDPAEWILISEMLNDGELYFTSFGGLFVASPAAFKFVCEHQESVFSLISRNC